MVNIKKNDLIFDYFNITNEIKKNNKLLNNKDITIFNSSLLPLNNSNYLVASRGWFGNVRSWDGINFVILTILDSKYKKKIQNVLDIDINILKNTDIKFKDFKNRIVMHEKKQLEGPEDPRLFYYNNDIYILINELDEISGSRLMYLSMINMNTLTYDLNKKVLCKLNSTSFEKNWGPFIYKKKLHMLYDINPLKVLEVKDDYRCKLVISKRDNILKNIESKFNDLNLHLRNSTNLISLNNNKYLGLGHAVLDYKNNTDINKYLIPLISESKYSNNDKLYFSKFYKLYLGFFYILDMTKKEIIKLSPFFQLPNYESKQELIFFPVNMYKDNNNIVNISYSIGDNRSYICKMNYNIIKHSLYTKNEFVNMGVNINPNYYTELIRTLRSIYNNQ